MAKTLTPKPSPTMYEKLQCIVLNVMKYSDKNSIAHVYSDRRGRLAFLLPQGSTRGARLRNAAFMPLSVVELEARIVPGKDIYSFRDARVLHPLTHIYGDPVRSAVAMFISEFLSHVIQESERNESLFRYISRSVMLLNSISQGVANFHICFVYNLGPFIGIQPDAESYTDGAWFDMQEGVFTPYAPPTSHRLAPMQARALYLLSRMSFANMHLFRYSREQRSEILDIMLTSFRIHNNTMGTLRTPDILHQLFE